MTSPAKHSPQKIIVKKKGSLLARLLAAFLGTAIVLLIAAPIAIKMGIQQLLSEQTQSEVTVAEVNLNIFSGKLFLRQLRIPHHSDAGQATSLEYASVSVDMKALFNQEIIVKEVILSHAEIAIDRTKKQLQVAGILLPLAAEATTAPELAAPEASANNVPKITIESIALESVVLKYRSDESNNDIAINSTIKNITTTNPTEAIRIAVNVAINGGTINYQGELLAFADEPSFSGELIITDADLATFAMLVPQDDFIINHLGMSHQSHINGVLPKEGTPRINLTGDITLSEINIVSALHSDTFVKAKSIEINKINVQYPTEISIDQIVVNDLNTTLYRDSDGNLLAKQETTTAPDAETAPSVDNKTQAPQENPLAFSLGSFSIKGDSTFAFKDAAVTPEFNIKLQPLALSIGRIDSTQSDAETAVTLSANLNETGTIKLAGHISPLADELLVTINNDLTNLSLPALSPYTEKHIGYQLRRGRLTAETQLIIKGKQLQVDNKLSLAKLSIKESDHEKAQGLIDQLEMPLDSALDLLRDGDDNIVFDLPINGSLDDPQFRLGGMMKLAIGKGMKMAAMNYLTSALQPLGTILLAKDIVGFVAKPRFKSLSFEAGKAEIDATNSAYLRKIGTLLKKRPKLSITLCGIATGDDRIALAETAKEIEPQLHRLAKTRADNARAFLSTQQGINGEKLFECNPTVNDNKHETPGITEGVEISL